MGVAAIYKRLIAAFLAITGSISLSSWVKTSDQNAVQAIISRWGNTNSYALVLNPIESDQLSGLLGAGCGGPRHARPVAAVIALVCRCCGKTPCLVDMAGREEDARLYGRRSCHALRPRRFSQRRARLRHQGRRPSFAHVRHRQDRHGQIDALGEHGAPRPGARQRLRADRSARRSCRAHRGTHS